MSHRGVSLVECLVALVVSSMILAAVGSALLAGRRFARRASAARLVRQNLHAGAAALRGDLEALSAAAGDVLTFSDSAVAIRAPRLFGITCDLRAPATVMLDDALGGSVLAPDPSKDSIRIFATGDQRTAADDRWVAGALRGTSSAPCPGGNTGTALTLTIAPPDFAMVAAGAPVRGFEVLEYRRYRDAAGTWWLGARTRVASGWSASSPVAGPLDGATGFRLRYLARDLSPATAADSIAMVEIALRMTDAHASVVDSLELRVAVP